MGTSTPEGWTRGQLADFVSVVDCKHLTADFTASGHPVVSIRELTGAYVQTEAAPRTSGHYFDLLTSGGRELLPGDLLMSRNATVGRVAQVPPRSEPMAMGQDVCRLRVLSDSVSPDFVQALLTSPDNDIILQRLMAGSTFKRLNVSQIKSIPMEIPPLPQQKRIAEALSDADELIVGLERLIAKKQAIKLGMMQQLLTGQTRLPGFTEEWREVRVGDIALIDPENLGTEASSVAEIDYISLENVCRGRLVVSNRMIARNAPSRARRLIRPNDVLFGTVRPLLQSHLLYDGGLRRPVASTGFTVVRASQSHHPGFLFYVLMSNRVTSQVGRIIAGSNYPAVSSGDVGGLLFDAPALEEQWAVAEALHDIDTEIELLSQRIAKAQAVKQGMMQELLTGRTRLGATEGAA